MANDLALHSELNLDDLQRTASMLVASGYFTGRNDERNTAIAQIATKIMAGRELGYGPFASVQGIHVIQGKPQLSANLMAAAVKAHPRYNYKVRKMDADAVSIEFFENGESIGTSTFTLEDAKRAGTQNLQKFPRNMLFARALSNGVRWFCPDVFYGQSVYVEGEIEDTGDDAPAVVVVDRETGEIVEGEYTTMQAPPVTPVTPANGKRNPAADMPERVASSELKHWDLEPHESLGNGHKTQADATKVLPFERASGVDTHFNAIEWAMHQGKFNARQHAENSYKKLSKELEYKGAKATTAETDALLWAWVEKVNAKPVIEADDNPFTETPEPVTA